MTELQFYVYFRLSTSHIQSVYFQIRLKPGPHWLTSKLLNSGGLTRGHASRVACVYVDFLKHRALAWEFNFIHSKPTQNYGHHPSNYLVNHSTSHLSEIIFNLKITSVSKCSKDSVQYWILLLVHILITRVEQKDMYRVDVKWNSAFQIWGELLH